MSAHFNGFTIEQSRVTPSVYSYKEEHLNWGESSNTHSTYLQTLLRPHGYVPPLLELFSLTISQFSFYTNSRSPVSPKKVPRCCWKWLKTPLPIIYPLEFEKLVSPHSSRQICQPTHFLTTSLYLGRTRQVVTSLCLRTQCRKTRCICNRCVIKRIRYSWLCGRVYLLFQFSFICQCCVRKTVQHVRRIMVCVIKIQCVQPF